jgi:4-aminobutyrate aminotransferase-like enzyme
MSYTHAIRLQPALTIDRDTALAGLSLLREAIETVARRLGVA